jgi:hypothetical protein
MLQRTTDEHLRMRLNDDPSIESLLERLKPNEFALKDIFLRELLSHDLTEVYDFGPPQDANVSRQVADIRQCGTVSRMDQELCWALRTSSGRFSVRDQPRDGLRNLFCITSLLQMAVRAPEYFWDEADIIARFTEQAIGLGPEIAMLATSLLAWKYLTEPGPDDDPLYLSLAILILAATTNQGNDVAWLSRLARWVLSHKPTLGDRMFGFEFLGEMSTWRSLVLRTILNPASPLPSEAAAELSAIGKLVLEGCAYREAQAE